MAVESATYATQFNTSSPASTDPRSEGDDHLRLIKAVLNTELGAGFNEWAYTALTATWRSTTRVSFDTDQTGVFEVGRRVRAAGSATGTLYGEVTSATFSASTSVNFRWDASALSNEAIQFWVGADRKSLPIPLTPQHFGAKGNGTTDDTSAFTAAAASGRRIYVPAAHYVIEAQTIVYIADVVAEDGAFTSGGYVRGLGYSSDGSAQSTTPSVAFKDAHHTPNGRMWFPSYYRTANDHLATSNLTFANSGSDSVGTFWEYTATGAPETSTRIRLPDPNQDVLFRIRMQGRLHRTLTIQQFSNSTTGSNVLNPTISWLGSGADDRSSTAAMWLCATLETGSINHNDNSAATHVELSFLEQSSQGAKVYSIETHTLGGPESKPVHPGYATLPFKGWATNELDSRFNWFNSGGSASQGGTLTFKEVYDYLRAQMVRYQSNGFRITVGIDDGFAATPYAGSYDSTSIRNLRFVLGACELLGIRFIPVLIYPSSSEADSNFPTMATLMSVGDTTYSEAVKDFIDECDNWDSVWGYDLISESADSLKYNTPSSPPSTDDHTTSGIVTIWQKLSDAAKTKTDKPIIYSLADGWRGVWAMGELDFSKVDAVDYHGYNRPWRFQTAAFHPAGFIPLSCEIGHATGGATDAVQADEIERAFHEAARYACTAWAWAPMLYDEGGNQNNATAMTRYQEM